MTECIVLLKTRGIVELSVYKYLIKYTTEPNLANRNKLSKKLKYNDNFQGIKYMILPLKYYGLVLLLLIL